MSDEIFEGNDPSEDRIFHAADLDLFSIANRYRKFWKLPERSPYHTAISLLIGKGLPYDTVSKIMEHIGQALGNKDISPKNFHITDKKLKSWGLSQEKIDGIRKILALEEVSSQSLCKIKEGGIYLVKAFKVIQEEDDDVFLPDDYNVLRNLGILFFRDKPMTKTEAMKLSRAWQGHRSLISYFLLKLKPDGAVKILDEEESHDFWGHSKPVTPSPTLVADMSAVNDDPVPELVKSISS